MRLFIVSFRIETFEFPRETLHPDIVHTLFKAGYIDSWGRGTIKIIEACKEAGLPEPVLKEEQGGFFSKVLKSSEKVRRKYGENTEKLRRRFWPVCT